MSLIAFIDKKWQSSITAYVQVTYNDGSRRHYVQGRYGGGSLTQAGYDQAKPYQPSAWKRYQPRAGRLEDDGTIISTDCNQENGLRAPFK